MYTAQDDSLKETKMELVEAEQIVKLYEKREATYKEALKVIAEAKEAEAKVAAEATEAELAETTEAEVEAETISADDVGKVEDIL